jgi:hypothetical protein
LSHPISEKEKSVGRLACEKLPIMRKKKGVRTKKATKTKIVQCQMLNAETLLEA